MAGWLIKVCVGIGVLDADGMLDASAFCVAGLLVPVNGALLHADEQPATRYCIPENPQIWCVLSEPSGGARTREREGGTSRAALWSNDCRRIQIDEMLVLIQGVQALGGWTLGGAIPKRSLWLRKQKNGESLREL